MAVAARTKQGKPGLGLLLISYFAFILLGMPDAMLGVAWPSLRATFEQPLEALGILLATGMLGYLVASASSGRLVARMGMGRFLLFGSAIQLIGLGAFVFSQNWWLLVALNLFTGLGGGAIDAGFNTYVATHYSAGPMGWLHASFGLGATLSPLLMTAVLQADTPWQTGYAVVLAVKASLVVIFLVTLSRWTLNTQNDDGDVQEAAGASARSTLRLAVVWVGIVSFFVYTGIEITAGQWPYSMFTEARGVPVEIAGLWVSIYWGGLTLGRVMTGLVADRIGPTRLLRMCMIGTIMGSVLIWLNVGYVVSFIGMGLTGFSLAAIFPVMISLTPQRVGKAHAPNAIGMQIGAAGAGIAALPALAGVLAGRISLELIGPLLLAYSILQWVLFEAGERWYGQRGKKAVS